MNKRTAILAILLVKALILTACPFTNVYIKFVRPANYTTAQLGELCTVLAQCNDTIIAEVTELQFNAFHKAGVSFQLIPASTFKKSSVVMATNVSQMSNWDRYPTHEVYEEMMAYYAREYPKICQLVNMGTSNQGRTIWAMKISDNVSAEEAEPEFLYTGSMHGDELVGYMLFLRLIDHLLSNYGTDDHVTQLVDNIEIWINPLSNPDGSYHGGNHTVASAIRTNSRYFDLNRDYPDPGKNDNPNTGNYETETQVMMDFANSHSFVLSANAHSGAEVLNYPWDTWDRIHPDDYWFYSICQEYADLAHQQNNNYLQLYSGVVRGYAWYEADGSRQDYMMYYKNCREVTFELSDTKILSSAILPSHWDYNRDGLLSYIAQCQWGISGVVSNSHGEPLAATITVKGHDADNSQVVTDPDVGDFYRMIEAGNYTLIISADGYITDTIGNVNVYDKQNTQLNITLQRDSMVGMAGIAGTTASITVSPNPVTAQTVVDVYAPDAGANQLTLTNQVGQIIDCPFKNKLTTGRHRFHLNNIKLKKGIYFLSLLTANGTVKTQKLLVP